MYYKSILPFQRDYKRRRSMGAGATHRSCVLRESLIEWWSTIRHSVDTNIMVRIPKALFLTKANELQCEYLAACSKHNVRPEHVDVTHRWLNRYLATYRIASQRPNRKFKVPRAILMQRLEIFWIVTAKLRTLVMLHFGYDPTFKKH